MTANAVLLPASTSDNPEQGVVAQNASVLRLVVGGQTRAASQLDNFTASASAGADTTTTFVPSVTLTTAPKPEPTDEELAEAGLEFVAEFEQKFGQIPNEVIADIQRKWPA